MADLGSLAGYDSSIATGINNSGTVVGVAYNSADTSQQVGFQWTQATGMRTVPGCQSASDINDRGQIVGIALDFDAAICGGQDFGIVGNAGAINNSGQAVGYSNDHAYVFPSTDLGPQSTATGVNVRSALACIRAPTALHFTRIIAWSVYRMQPLADPYRLIPVVFSCESSENCCLGEQRW
jgi:hypothetical protein